MRWVEEKCKLVLPKSEGRSIGLHISEVIRDYAIEASVLDRKWVTETLIEDQNTNLMQVGLGWEEYLANYQHPEIEFHPGELYVDDDEFCMVCLNVREDCTCKRFKANRIYMSPDGISSVDPEDYADIFRHSGNFCHEFKFTKKSSRDFCQLLNDRSPKTLMWQWQIMCYCSAMRTLAAKLHAMFINGNYSRKDNDPDSLADYRVFRAEYTQDDIDSNMNKFKKHARSMLIAKQSLAA